MWSKKIQLGLLIRRASVHVSQVRQRRDSSVSVPWSNSDLLGPLKGHFGYLHQLGSLNCYGYLFFAAKQSTSSTSQQKNHHRKTETV